MPADVTQPAAASPMTAPSVSRSLQVLAVVLFVLIMAGTGWQIMQRRAASLADAHAQVSALDRVLAEQTGRAVASVDVILRELIDRPLPGDANAMAAALRRRVDEVAQILAIDIVDSTGKVRLSSRASPDDRLPPEGLALLAEPAAATGTLMISSPLRQPDGRWTALAGRPMAGGGMAVAWLNLDYFESFYKAAALGRSGAITLHRRDGVMLVRTPHLAGTVGINHANTAPFSQVLAHGDAGSLEMDGTGGKGTRILAIRALHGAPLAVTVSQDKSGVLAGWRREARAFALAAVAAGLVVATLMLQLARRSRQVETLLAEQRQVNVSARAANEDMAVQMIERERAEKALRQIQRVEAVGQLTGGVAHDFNNLLTVLLGNLELLQSNSQAAPFAARLATMRAAAERGASLIGHLLAFSRRQPLQPRAVNLSSLILAMQPLLQSAVGSQVELVFDFAAATPQALVDPTQIELVILNLAINARDAMPAGGTLRLAVGMMQLESSRVPDAPHGGSYVGLRVTDSGTGMTEEVRSRAFEPYFTTKPLGTRSGLGLSQVYGVARQSGGLVRIDSRLGAGTTVTVVLPLADSIEPEFEPPAVPFAAIRSGTANLLVVDDDNDVRATTALLLRRAGYNVTEAGSAEQALAILGEVDDIELLLSDVVMPHVTGPELARRAHALRPMLPVVFFSGYADPESIAGTVPLTRLVRKPFRPADLTNLIEAVLAESRVGVAAG